MSFQSVSGAYPTQPPVQGGPAAYPGSMHPSGAMYSPGAGPPGGMYPMHGSPVPMMNMQPHFQGMRPGMGQPGILPMPPMAHSTMCVCVCVCV